MALLNYIKALCVGLFLSLAICTHANSNHNIYSMTLAIMSYVKTNQNNNNLCVIDNNEAFSSLSSAASKLDSDFKVLSLQAKELSKQNCSNVFFSKHTPIVEQKLISESLNKSTLSFSSNNLECEIGSVFCLYSNKNGVTQFKVNLDALAKSKMRIDPRVLLLAHARNNNND